jgi:hypothetical protein
MSSLVIFGIVSAEAGATLDLNGLAEGIHLIADGDIAAIAAPPPSVPEVRTGPREETARRALQHQHILEAIIAETTVLPVKFGTVAPDETAVRRMLIQGHTLLAAQLQQFAGRLQMDVAVEWPLKQVFIEIAGEPIIAELRAAAIDSDDSDAKFQLGLAVKAALDLRRTAYLAEISDALRPVVQEIAANPIAEERIVANIALLMERDGLDAFDSVLDQLDADHDNRLKFRCAGPLAPSAFATIEVSFPTREAVEHAWHVLQLGARTNVAEITSSYFRIARELHPDRARREGQSPEMDELAEAHGLLMACAKTSGEELQLHGPALLAVSVAHPGQPIAETEADHEAAA